MKARVYCNTRNTGFQEYYLQTEKECYFLFTQHDKKSSRLLFSQGVLLCEIFDYSKRNSFVVRKTKDKLKKIIPQIERRHGITILDRNSKRPNNSIA